MIGESFCFRAITAWRAEKAEIPLTNANVRSDDQ
jgi:hypothetical protein